MDAQRICSIDGCGKPQRGPHGLCNAHRLLHQRKGTTALSRAPNGAGLSFLQQALTSDTDECIIWPYGKETAGYGRIVIGSETHTTHRYVCEKTHGPPTPPATYACHSCAVRACVNPRHVRWGTNTDNYWDMVRHGNRNNTVLNEDLVAQIKQSTVSARVLAHDYGVSVATINKIRNGSNWKHVA